MPGSLHSLLTPERALIFRLIHRDNLPWIFRNGLHCRNSGRIDPNFVGIGNPSLIEDRRNHPVPMAPGGTLADYIPFYFTPASMMLYNIYTGYHGVQQRNNKEVVFLVSSLHRLEKDGIDFLFTDRHARLRYACYYKNTESLPNIPWPTLQNKDFRRDNENPDKTDRYQAEALVYNYLPISSLLGIACYNDIERDRTRELVNTTGVACNVVSRGGWYFS